MFKTIISYPGVTCCIFPLWKPNTGFSHGNIGGACEDRMNIPRFYIHISFCNIFPLDEIKIVCRSFGHADRIL